MYRHIDINRKLQYFLVDFSDLTASENLFFRIFLIQTITFADFFFFADLQNLKNVLFYYFDQSFWFGEICRGNLASSNDINFIPSVPKLLQLLHI